MAHSRSILRLKQIYGAASPVSSGLLTHLLSRSDSAQLQDELVNDLLLSSHFQNFPPSRESCRVFWKWVIEHLEASGEEVDERIYDAYLNDLSSRSHSLATRAPSPSYTTHFWSSHHGDTDGTLSTTLLESRTMIEGGTTGFRTWGASLKLADWIVTHPNVVQGHRVLELGSGAGFLGLVIASLQLESDCCSSSSLVLSDVNPEVLSRCRRNFQLSCNRMSNHPSLDFRILDWSDALDGEANVDVHSPVNDTLKDVDTIVGADLIYDVSIIPALIAVLTLFFRTKITEKPASQHQIPCAYIAMAVRKEQTASAFLSSLSSHALQYFEVEMARDYKGRFLGGAEDSVNCDVKLIRVTQSP